ncbi:MAG: ATP-binding protein [Algoriphagus sp.]|nr:ATP-binding protein [Algoriphagus sp.]
MQERGINSTFKKIIYESSEMVFLADDSFPYSIFYANESFEEQIGESLKERNLVGLGLDINAYIFKEELILTHEKKDYAFRIELPQESSSNYFLFYKGKEVRTHGLPSKKEAQQFFKSSLDLIAIGQHDYLTYLNGAVQPVLGYAVEELLNTSLCSFIHEDDLEEIRNIWKQTDEVDRLGFFNTRFKSKDGDFRYLECSVQFTEDRFFIIARDGSEKAKKKEKEAQLISLKNLAPDHVKVGIWQYDLAFEILTFDKAASLILKSSDQIEFKADLKGVEKQIKTAYQSQLNSLKTAKTELDFSFEIKDSSGEILYFSVKTSSSIKGEKATEIVGIVWDESPRIELQQKIKLHEKLLFDSPEALLIVTQSGEVFLFNEEGRKLFGLEENGRIGHLRDLSAYFEEADQWKEWIEVTETGPIVRRFSSLLISPAGKQLTLEVASKLTSLDDKYYIQLSFKNITEKVTLEKTLEESGDFLMNLTEQVPGGLYQLVLDSEGKMSFSFLSKGIGSVLGLKADEMGQFTDISVAISRVHPMDLPNVIMTSVASARKQQPWQCQFRVKTNVESNEYKWILGAARPQSLENGDMVWYGYLTDISEQKQFETKLDEARKGAEKANQIKSDFLSMISHELRTPLNAISGSTYSLLQEQPSEHQKTALNTINFAVDNLIIMINDLLDFQKIEAGKLTIEKTPFQLGELISQIMKGLSFHARDSKNALELHLSEGLDIWVKGDKTRLSQVLNNLITNALKFTNEGNVDVKVQLKEVKNGKAKVYFEVKDNGIGIAPENQEMIFNDFDQVKPTFSTKYGGTGLGLSITRKLLNLMGGAIALQSEPGKGSTFFFDLVFDLSESQNETPSTGNSPIPQSNHLHLLMAEDNDVNALVLGKIIKKWGFEFQRVVNGEEAVKAVKDHKFDCILMDIQMPVMDGFDATKEIKKFSQTPVIALTAAAKLEILERIDECGFDGFVAKPIDAAELLKKIREVVSENNQRA